MRARHGLLVLISEEATWSPPTPLTSEKVLQSDRGQLGVTFPPETNHRSQERVLTEQAGPHPRRADRGEEKGAVCRISDPQMTLQQKQGDGVCPQNTTLGTYSIFRL